MTCPVCGEKSVVVSVSRSDTEVVRRRECRGCGEPFYTLEAMIDSRVGRRKHMAFKLAKRRKKENEN